MTDQITTEEAVERLTTLRADLGSLGPHRGQDEDCAALSLAINRLSTPSVGELVEAAKALDAGLIAHGYFPDKGRLGKHIRRLRAAILSVEGGN